MPQPLPLGTPDRKTLWIADDLHKGRLKHEADALFRFFTPSCDPSGGFYLLDYDGRPYRPEQQELHTTTRLVHSFGLGAIAGRDGCEDVIDQGMAYLWQAHRDAAHGGYVWGIGQGAADDTRKLAYGHVFVLLAGSTAKMAGHPDADRLIADVTEVLQERFWEEQNGLFCDEFNRDWTPFSDYRGMNANMHGVEALLTAYEATGTAIYLDWAGRILDFFMMGQAARHGWRLPEHYTADWQVDRAYSGDPMFRPAGTTPGHSFELARLMLQHWDLKGRPDTEANQVARDVIEQALVDGMDTEKGGIVYTLDFDGRPMIRDRYWWPVTEAIGAMASLLKIDGQAADEEWYRVLWKFADRYFIDHTRGGWYPEIDAKGQATSTQFPGKPDIYHALQATLFPLCAGLSRYGQTLSETRPLAG